MCSFLGQAAEFIYTAFVRGMFENKIMFGLKETWREDGFR